MRFGAFAGGRVGTGSQLSQLEGELGARLSISSSFSGLGALFPAGEQLDDAASGHTLLVAWDLGSTASSRFTTWSSGLHDDYLRAEADRARSFGSVFYVRPWAELNGDWSSFQPTADGVRPAGGTPAEFIAAWRHVVEVFRTRGASNVKWVFNPATDTYTGTTDVRTLYPGNDVVDVLGLDGYNWGTGGVLSWRSFSDVYRAQYDRLVALAPGLQVWVCEFASKEPALSDGAPVDAAHSKAQWYRDALADTSFPAVRALVMFDVSKEREWRVGSDPAAATVVARAARAAAA